MKRDQMCATIKENGKRCQAKPLKGTELCFRHTPGLRRVNQLASSKGGLNRRLQGSYGQAVELESAKDVKHFLGMVMNAVWTGQIPVQVGTSMGFLARCFLDAYEASTVDEQLTEIEKLLKEKST